VVVGDLRLDPLQRRVWRGDIEITLTSTEFNVLEHLLRHAGEVVSKSRMLEAVWDDGFEGDSNIVEVYIRRLRSKIDDPFGVTTITTVRGAGYRLEDGT
jgi:DNA-binding response OmpR family regulator